MTGRGGTTIVLVPIEPSGLSTWASDLTVRQVQEAQELKIIKCCFVVSRKIGNTVIGREIRSMAAAMGIPILANEIAQRVAYAESLTMGKMMAGLSGAHSKIIMAKKGPAT